MKKILTLILTLLCAMCAVCAVCTACGGSAPEEAVYYLSRGEVYTAEADIPAADRFARSGDSYTLTADLAEGESFTVNRLGGESLGYAALFSVRTELEEGENGSILVGESGAYALTLTDGALSYTFKAKGETPPPPQGPVAVTGVSLDKTQLSIELNEETTLVATVLPENADNQNIVWFTDDDSVAIVSNGRVTAVGYGTATITVSTAQGGFTAECEITVVRHVSAIRLDAEAITVVANGEPAHLSVVYSPAEATYRTCDFEITAGEDRISLEEDDGEILVTGLAVGTATVQATLKENPALTATCTVTVLAAGSILARLQTSVTAMIDEPTTLTVSLENAELATVAWSVADPAVATIEGNGPEATLTGVDFGSTVVTAAVTSESGTVYEAKCNVLVSDEWYFIYGYGLGVSEYWDYSYVTDKNAAERDGLLFTEVDRGIFTLKRYLTPDNGFQIIFPKVGNYSQYDEVTDKNIWDKNIPSQWVNSGYYYDLARSDGQYLSNERDYFRVNRPGVYAVTLDLTGASAKVYIKMVSLDVESVSWNLEEGQVALKSGEEVKIGYSVTPSAATFSKDQFEVKLTSEFAKYADFVKYDVNFEDKTITVSVSGTLPQSFDVTLKLTIRGVSTFVELYILSDMEPEVAVSSVTFEQEHYYVNVNQGGAEDAWQQFVKATVNQDATNQTVRYFDVTNYNELKSHDSGTYASVNAETGLVTGKVLGTVTIKAVALGDERIFDTCAVTFYSDALYLIGGASEGVTPLLGGWTPLDTTYKTVEGTAFEKYQFQMLSETHFQLTASFVKGTQFQIAFCGIDKSLTAIISYAAVLQKLSNAVFGWDKDYENTNDYKSTRIVTAHTYVIDVDLSKHRAFWTLNVQDKEEFGGFALSYDESHTDLKKDEKVEIGLYFFPETEIAEKDISYTLEGGEYLDAQFEYATKKLILTVRSVDKGEDKQATLTVTVKGKQNSIDFKILAEHHLKQMKDKDFHWMECTDEGCDYIEGKVAHSRGETYTFSPEGHYYACSGCDIQFDFEPHQYDLGEGVVFDLTEPKECSVCHHALFEINDGVLEGYYFTKAETVKIPNSVTALGDHVFEGHTELKTLTNSEKLKKIGAYAFAGCTNLQGVKIPNPVTEIGMYAFQGTAAAITWGRNPSINTIGKYAFYGYLGTALTIPDTVKELLEFCFANSNLQEFIIPDTVENINVMGLAGHNLFKDCTSLRKVVIGKGITKIEEYAFTNCVALESVFIRGTGFWTISMYAFDGCVSIKEVYIERPLNDILTCGQLFLQGNDALKGHCYVYSATDPGDDPFGEHQGRFFGYFRDWFAGCWQWDESGVAQTDMSIFDHVSLWTSGESSISLSSPVSLALPPRSKLYL